MALKIRLARGGTHKKPFYRIVVADIRCPRDGRFIEKLGTYDPRLNHEHPQRIILNQERAQHWLKVGAKPTDRVAKFLSQVKLVDMPSQRNNPKKSQPKQKAQERAAEAAKKAAESAS